MCPEALVISGDFNLHLDDLRDNDTKKFMDLLETFSLSQHVSGPTHLSGHTLDLIITRSSDDIVLASPKTTFPISDHFIIQYPIGFSRPALSYKKLTFRKLKNIDIAAFSADIASSMLCASVHQENIDAFSDCFNKILTDILDKFAPLKTRTIVNRPKVPWFHDDIKQLRCQRRRLEKRTVKTDLPGDWNNYHKVRNQYFAFLKSARVNYYSNSIDQCAGESRKLFRVVNSLCREPLETALPEHTDSTTVASTVKKNVPLPKLHSGFRKYHSTETALSKVQQDILMRMDNKEVTLLVLLDPSAAFDTIEHSILLNILQQDCWSRRDCFKSVRLISIRSQTTYTCW